MIDRPGTENEGLAQSAEAADRAGAIVSDHVRSIIDAAQARADEMERTARQEAEEIRRSAHGSATRMLERIDAMEGQLNTLVSGLRREVDQLAGDLDRRG